MPISSPSRSAVAATATAARARRDAAPAARPVDGAIRPVPLADRTVLGPEALVPPGRAAMTVVMGLRAVIAGMAPEKVDRARGSSGTRARGRSR